MLPTVNECTIIQNRTNDTSRKKYQQLINFLQTVTKKKADNQDICDV